MRVILRLLQSGPFPGVISDPELVRKKYVHWRLRIMYSMFLGYVFYYFTRKSFTFAMPALMDQLHLDKGQLGLMGTIFALTYGVSKFFSGVISDQSNPRYFMAFGLILTGVCNILFGLSNSLWLFGLFWGLNAWFQGCGWPPCVKLLSYWYSHSERGGWWSTWSVSQNVGGFITPWVVTICLVHFGWRGAMCMPGILAIIGGLILLNRLSDVPRSQGLPTIEEFRQDFPARREEGEEPKLSSRELMRSVLRNRFIWMLSIAYFCIYFIRTGIGDWTMLFMIETKGYSHVIAGGIASLFEVGGFLGALSAGWISDRLFRARRGPVNLLFALLLVVLMVSFWSLPGGYAWIDSAMIFLLGFATFGPQLLVGVAVAEFAHKQASATATGFAGWVAYLGSALAGFPLGVVLEKLGWQGLFISMLASSIGASLLLLPFWRKTKETTETAQGAV